MTGPGITYYIMSEDRDGKRIRIVKDENKHVLRSKEIAESYEKEHGIEDYEVIDAETYMNLAQRAIANREQ